MRYRIRLLLLLVVLSAALACGWAYTALVNPEMRWLLSLHEVKRAAAERAEGERVLVMGGSSVLFGVDTDELSRLLGKPAVNLGMHAGMGGLALLGYADSYSRPGDLLVISLEPDLLEGDVRTQRLGDQFLFLAGLSRYAQGGDPPLAPRGRLAPLEAGLSVCAPGLRQLANHAGKWAAGRKMYRYGDLRPNASGYLPEKISMDFPPVRDGIAMSPQWRDALAAFVAGQQARGVRVVYSLPWFLVDDPAAACGGYLKDLNAFLPIVRDYDWAAMRERANYSDTPAHLSVEGGELRTRALARALLQGDIAPVGGFSLETGPGQ